jgi:hypothetical protein
MISKVSLRGFFFRRERGVLVLEITLMSYILVHFSWWAKCFLPSVPSSHSLPPHPHACLAPFFTHTLPCAKQTVLCLFPLTSLQGSQVHWEPNFWARWPRSRLYEHQADSLLHWFQLQTHAGSTLWSAVILLSAWWTTHTIKYKTECSNIPGKPRKKRHMCNLGGGSLGWCPVSVSSLCHTP